MRNHNTRKEISLPTHEERQRWWAVGRELLSTDSDPARRQGAALVARAMALPAGVELDESLCRRAGIPLEWLEELRTPERAPA